MLIDMRWMLISAAFLSVMSLLVVNVAGADVSERFGGTNNTHLIASANVVFAWRTAGSLKTNDYYGELLWKKGGAPMMVSTNLARELSKILLDEKTYYEVDGAPKNALSWPSVMMNFTDGKASLDLFFSFRDNSLAVKVGTEKFGSPLLVESNIDPSRAKILAIIKKIFPDDPYIQGLPDKL